MGIFTWLRRKVAQAILGGVEDAFAQLEGSGEHLPATLRDRVQALLPEPVNEPESEPVANGRARRK